MVKKGQILKWMIFWTLLNASVHVLAQEMGHYAPGAWDIRSFITPSPGLYFAVYNYLYTSNDLKNQYGNSIQSTIVNGVPVQLNVDINTYSMAPTLLWAPKRKILAANYAFMLFQPIANPSLQSSFQIVNTGFSAHQSTWGLGDPYVRPIWLTWRWPAFNFSASYGVYAPTGKYHNRSRSNIGLGFWTHELQGIGAWYPDAKHSLAVVLAATYDVNQRKIDVNIRPGNYFSLNWGISQLFPVGRQGILEVGIPGYDQWQITDDSGTALIGNSSVNQVHAAGLELGYTIIPLNLVITGKCLQEFKAKTRFQGRVYTLSFSIQF